MLDQARSGREKSRQATVIKRGRQEIQVGFGKKKKHRIECKQGRGGGYC